MLAFDTATDRATFAAGMPGGHASDHAITERRRLSRVLDEATATALREAGIAARDIGAVVVADGPGSFTGLRIGVAFAKGLCRALGVPLLTAPSLLGAARAACPGEGTVTAEYDALRGEVYRAVYRFAADGSVVTLQPPALRPAGESAEGPRASELDASATALVLLAGVPGALVAVPDPASWEPTYGRPAEAEARLLERQGRTAGS